MADKAYDADEQVREPLAERGIQSVIPSRKNRLSPYPYNKDLYKARHLTCAEFLEVGIPCLNY